jgi:NADH-quinone oxidoreductase subunit E
MSDVYVLSEELKKEIDHWVAKFPIDRKLSALIPAMNLVQEKESHVSEAMMDAVADYLGVPRIAAYEVGTFYTLYDLEPRGKHRLDVCTNVSCMLRGSDEIMGHLKNRLGVDVNGTSKDGMFTLRSVECLGSCGTAPMMQVGKDYHENLTPKKVDEILDKLKGDA